MDPISLALLGLGLSWTSHEVHRFEKTAATEIRSRLQGKEAKVEVKAEPHFQWGAIKSATIQASNFSLDGLPLYTEPKRSQAGHLDLLSLRLFDFRLKGLRISELSADIPNCRFDLGLALGKRELRLSKSGVGAGVVKVDEKDLAEWIERKYAEIKHAKVRVYNDIVWVDGYGEFLVVKTNFTVIAKLEAIDGTKLTLTHAKIYFDWNRADEFAAQTLLKTLNPVVDLQKDLGLADAIYVESIRLRDGVVEAKGRTKIPDIPAENNR